MAADVSLVDDVCDTPWSEHIQIACTRNNLGIKADRYARYTESCVAARSGKDIIFGAVEDNEPSSSWLSGGQARFANRPPVVATHGEMRTGVGPDHLRAPVVSI